MDKRQFKQVRYSAFAEVGKIFSNAKRLEIIDVLIQRPHSVEEIARSIGSSIASTSQHLQVLKRANAVSINRQGTTIIYSVMNQTVVVFLAMRRLAEQISPELQNLRQRHNNVPLMTYQEVQMALSSGKATLLDVRTPSEFVNGHMKGAICIPLHELDQRVEELKFTELVIVTCRGPYCFSSDEAARQLVAHGFTVYRYDDGIAEWCAQGGVLCTPES